MAIEDIDELYEEYVELDSYRAFLFTPSDVFAGELDLIEPSLSLKKDGFDLLDFRLSARLFDFNTTDLSENPFIDSTLDGYYIIFEFGDLTTSNYQERRFIIKGRVANLQDEQVTHSYSAISAEHELKKLPIINWPGIQVKEYKDVNGENSDGTSRAALQAREQLNGIANPELLNDSIGDYQPIKLKYTPKDGRILVFRMHKTYKIEIPLFETTPFLTEIDRMPINEYFYDRDTNQVIAWVPAHLKVATGPNTNAYNPIGSELYDFHIYYEPEEDIDEEDIIEGEFEKAYFYNTDGLTINQILEDLFQILESEEGNLRYFLRWTYDKANSYVSDEIRSEINFSNTSVYDMLKSLEENYQLYIDFDTITRKITVRERLFGTNNGLRFEYGKYLLSVSQDYNTDEIVTYVQGQDANGVGFADVSWSGDNYVENYDYYLDGVTWTPEGGLVGVSRWMTSELAEVLAQIKYYQEFYEAEVWGDETKKGIANLRFELQELLNEIDFNVIEVQKEIDLKKAVLENYLSDTSKRSSMDTFVKKIPNNIVTDLVPGTNFKIDLNMDVDKDNRFSVTTQQINQGSDVSLRSFTLKSNTILGGIFIGGRTIVPESNFITNIRVTFKTGAQVKKTISLTVQDINKEIPLNETIVCKEVQISLSIQGLSGVALNAINGSYNLKEIIIFEADQIQNSYIWPTYDKYIQSIILDLTAKKTILEIEQNAIKYGRKIDFEPTEVVDESEVYELNEENLNSIGIGQIELRLEEIQTYTSIDHDALEPAVLDELKAFRKGAVYSNNDIRNSKTLFVAARNELEEIIFPMITIDIASVSILQTYEGFEDWGKVRIGEKVDIFVPQLKISIEAEIVELSMNFQDYSTSVKISTVRNYDKSFGRIFSNVFLLGNKTSKNEVLPLQKTTERAKEFLNDNSKNISDLGGSSIVVGAGGSNNSLQFDNMDIASSFVDTATDTLTTTPPLYYTEQEIAARGTAQITNGGLYIKDAEGEVRIKMNALEGLVGFKTDEGVTTESFKIDLEGNATFSGRLEAASGTFGAVSVNREFAVYEASVLEAPFSYIVSNIVYTGEEQLEGLFLEEGNSKSLNATTGQIIAQTQGSVTITNEWMARPGYTGIAIVSDGSHITTSADIFQIGTVIFFTDDNSYYEVIGVEDSTVETIYYIVLSIPQKTGSPREYGLRLNLSSNLYQLPSRRISHEWDLDTFISFDITSQYALASNYQNKTITFTETLKSSLTDILGLALASSGLGSVVTSINGQSGDVELELQSAVTSVNGQIGDVELDIPVTHVGRYEPEGIVDTWLVTQSIGQGEVAASTPFDAIFINIASTPIISLNQTFEISMADDTPVSTNSMIQLVVIGDDGGAAVTQIFANDINNIISGNVLITENSSVNFTLTPTIVNNTIVSYETTVFQNTGISNITEFQALALEVVE